VPHATEIVPSVTWGSGRLSAWASRLLGSAIRNPTCDDRGANREGLVNGYPMEERNLRIDTFKAARSVLTIKISP